VSRTCCTANIHYIPFPIDNPFNIFVIKPFDATFHAITAFTALIILRITVIHVDSNASILFQEQACTNHSSGISPTISIFFFCLIVSFIITLCFRSPEWPLLRQHQAR
jgi:hypothetical protein